MNLPKSAWPCLRDKYRDTFPLVCAKEGFHDDSRIGMGEYLRGLALAKISTKEGNTDDGIICDKPETEFCDLLPES